MSIPFEPKPYQLDAIAHLCANPGAGLFLDPGMGKTASTLAAFTVLKEEDVVDALFVIAPLRPCYKVWPAEIEKWADFAHLTYTILHGAKKTTAHSEMNDADVYIVNYDGLKWLEKVGLPRNAKTRWMVALDESTKIKNPRAVRTDIATKLALDADRIVILTGTPAPRSYLDLFSQVRAIDGGKRLGKFVTHYRRAFFDEKVEWGGYSTWTLKPGADELILSKISDVCLTLKAQDHLDMPELVDNVIACDLPAHTRDKYDTLAAEFYLALDAGEVTPANAAVMSMKLRQIVGGGVYTEDGEAGEFETGKTEALADLVEEQSGQPLLVAVGFKHEVNRIRRALGYPAPYIGGGVSTRDVNRIIDEWNCGEHPVLLAHPTSVAHGLNLQAGGHSVCWYTLTWNLEEYLQFNARVWRQGQKSPVVTVHHLIAEATVDERVLDVLRQKDRAQNAILNALKKGRR